MRWRTRRLGFGPRATGAGEWIEVGFDDPDHPEGINLDDWIVPEDADAFAKLIHDAGRPRFAMVVYGVDEALAKGQVTRVKAALAADAKKGEDAGLPDDVELVDDDDGRRVRVKVRGAREDVPYKSGESDADLKRRIRGGDQARERGDRPEPEPRIKNGADQDRDRQARRRRRRRHARGLHDRP